MRNSFGGWSEVAQRFRYSNSIRPQFTCGLKDLRPALQQLAIFGYFKPEIRPAKLAARRVRGGSAKLPKFLHIPFARFFQLRADPPANRLHASGGFPRAAARDSSRGAPGCCAATRDHPRQRRGRGQLPHPGSLPRRNGRLAGHAVGRKAAHHVAKFLMGSSSLPRCDRIGRPAPTRVRRSAQIGTL